MKRPTIADVAARAGVAKSTVSHALSGKRPVSETTRQRVQEAIDELGYRPDPVASRLAGGRSKTIGLVYPLYESQIAAVGMEFITSVASIINEAQYTFLLLTHLKDMSDNLERIAQSGLVEGFLLMQIRLQDPRVEMLRRWGLPFVMVGRCEDNRGLAYVDIDVEAATAHCVDYLVGQGHRHLAYLHQDDPGFGFLERSLVGFRVACQRHGALYRTLLAGDDPAEGRSAMNRLLDQYPETSGVIAWSGKVGWGAMQAIEANKLRSPEDITVACFHDPEIGSLLPCQSAMIDIRPAEVAIRAAHLLLAILEGESPVKTQVLVPAGFITPEGTTILNIDLDGPH